MNAFHEWPRRSLTGLVRAYRYVVSPWLGASCRFEPTCSAYAIDAIDRHGAAAGSYLAARRILRCHPFCEPGHDPVPERAPWPFHSSSAPGALAASPPPSKPEPTP